MENQTQTRLETQVQSQRKVAGFDKAMVIYRKVAAEAERGLVSKRKEEYVAYVKRVVFNNGDEAVVHLPDLHVQKQVVARMKDLKQ